MIEVTTIPDGDEAAGCNHCSSFAVYRIRWEKVRHRSEYLQLCEPAARALLVELGELIAPEMFEDHTL
jgi:hypothetical protein